MSMGTDHVYWAKWRCTNLFCVKKSYVTVDADGSPIFLTINCKHFLVVDTATNRDHCMTHRPNFHMYFKLLTFRHNFYSYIFQYFQKKALSKPCSA